MNRRNLLKTFLAAPAIIRSGVLMPVVPLVAAPLSGIEVLRRSGWFGVDLATGPDLAATYTVKIGPDGKVQGFGLRGDQWTEAERRLLAARGAEPLVFNSIRIRA